MGLKNPEHIRTYTGLKKLSVIKRFLLLGGNLKKIVTFRTKCFVRYSWHVRYLGCPPLGDFTVFPKKLFIKFGVVVFRNGKGEKLKYRKD